MAIKTETPSSPINETPVAVAVAVAAECSICLDQVIDNNSQAIAKLKCGHVFHMSCIGCEFNVRGAMQCPNCRVTEDSDWLFCVGAPELEIEDADEEMPSADTNIPCPHGNRNCPGHRVDDPSPLTIIRDHRVFHIGSNGNGSNFVCPGVLIHRNGYFAPQPLAPPGTPIHQATAARISIANRILNHGQPLIIRSGPNGHNIAVEGVLTNPTLARNHIMFGRDPPLHPVHALFTHRGRYWTRPREMNLFGLEPSVFNQGSRASTSSTDPLELSLTSGVFMEQMPVFPQGGYFYGMQSNPFDQTTPEDRSGYNADPRMRHFF